MADYRINGTNLVLPFDGLEEVLIDVMNAGYESVKPFIGTGQIIDSLSTVFGIVAQGHNGDNVYSLAIRKVHLDPDRSGADVHADLDNASPTSRTDLADCWADERIFLFFNDFMSYARTELGGVNFAKPRDVRTVISTIVNGYYNDQYQKIDHD